MEQEFYVHFQKIEIPTIEQTFSYVDRFCSEHSWYKHLDWNEPTEFVFYIEPNKGDWCYYSNSLYSKNSIEAFNGKNDDEPISFLPIELRKKGTFGLTGLIYDSFRSNQSELGERHKLQKTELIEFLNELLKEYECIKDQA